MVPIRTQAVNAWEAGAMVEIASPWEDRGIIDDPYPFYEKLRESAPVWRVPGSRTFYVAPWALVAEAVARPDDFSSNLTAVLIADADGLPAEFDMTPLGSAINVLATGDEPDHGPAAQARRTPLHCRPPRRARARPRLGDGPTVVGIASRARRRTTAALSGCRSSATACR